MSTHIDALLFFAGLRAFRDTPLRHGGVGCLAFLIREPGIHFWVR